MRRHKPTSATATVTGLFLLGLLGGTWAGKAAVARATDPYAGLDAFARVLTAIEGDYVEPVPSQALIDAAIEGMVDQLDPHSTWMSAEQVAALRADAEGEITGIGVEVEPHADGIRITKVLPGSPAAREGLSPGDQILAVDGTRLAGLPLPEVEAAFVGERGQEAVLTVLRDGWQEPRELQTLRDTVRTPAVEGMLVDGAVMYVRIIDFQRGAALELEALVRKLNAEASPRWAGLILDLRDNTGGLLAEAVSVTDLFLDEGPIVSTRERVGAEEVHKATAGGLPRNLDVVVLTNGLSASASEIVAGALQETGRAKLVGTRTYGKGSVQQLYRNPNGSALKLTVARYYTPSGAPVADKEGREPDVVVSLGEDRGPKERLVERLKNLDDVDPIERDHLVALASSLTERKRGYKRLAWTPLETRAVDDPQIAAAMKLLTEE